LNLFSAGKDASAADKPATFAPQADPALPEEAATLEARPPEDPPELIAEMEQARAYPPAILFTAPKDGDFYHFGNSAILGAELAHKVYGGGFDLIVENEDEGPLYNRVSHFGRVKIAAGHLFESSLAENAPYYKRFRIPVLLPFLDNWETATLGSGFYQLMPDIPAQARLLAERTLKIPSSKLSRIIILESPAAPFQLLADTYVATLKDPSALSTGKQKKRPLAGKVKVLRFVIHSPADLATVIAENKLNPQDVVFLALSNSQAVQVAPYFIESNFQKATFLGGASLANRDVCLVYLASKLNLELVVPLDLKNSKIDALNQFIHRFRLSYKQEPTWPSVLAYDAVTMAIKASSVPEGALYLNSGDKGPEGLAGYYSFADRKVPAEVVKVVRESAVYFP
jgi:ABC-type branched-subunit amino acid transport system substrate-binding protein